MVEDERRTETDKSWWKFIENRICIGRYMKRIRYISNNRCAHCSRILNIYNGMIAAAALICQLVAAGKRRKIYNLRIPAYFITHISWRNKAWRINCIRNILNTSQRHLERSDKPIARIEHSDARRVVKRRLAVV